MGADEYFDCIQSLRIDFLELFGSGYVIDHCVSTLNMKYRQDLFRDYMAEGIRATVNNLSHVFGGVTMEVSYHDLIHPPKKETRTEEEIINHIQEKLKG